MLNTKDRLPAFLQQTTFWADFIEEVDVELSELKEYFDERKSFFNPSALATIADLRSLLQFFGFEPDLSFLNDRYNSNPEDIIEYLQREAEDIVFKIKSKGSKNYFDYIFNRVQKKGDFYVLFYDSTSSADLNIIETGNFYRALNFYDSQYPKIDKSLLTHDFATTPFTLVTPLQPFFEGFLSGKNLDEDLILDDDWNLDYSLFGMSASTTKHIAVEFQVDEIFTIESNEYLITETYLRYLKNSALFGKKGSEYPHVGISVSAYTLNDEIDFVTPITEVTTAVTANWTGNSRTDYNDLYSNFYIGTNSNYFYQNNISDNQIFVNESFDIVNLSFPLNKVNEDIIGTGNGSNDSFSTTFSYLPVEKKSVKIVYDDVNSITRTIIDDGFGNLYYPEYFTTEQLQNGQIDLTDYASGTINYDTGEVSLTTVVTVTPTVDVTPKSAEDLLCNYYTEDSYGVDSLTILDSTGSIVVTCSFPYIPAINKNYHASFLIIIDRR